MGVVVILMIAVAAPIGVMWWTLRALRRWTGGWRIAALGPATMVLIAIAIAVRGLTIDPMGHGGALAIALGLCVLATLSAYVLSELHHARAARASIPTAPPNER